MKNQTIPVTVAALTLALSAFAESRLERDLKKLIKAHHGKVGLYAENLKTGEKLSLDGDALVPTASTIKLAVFVEAFHQVKDGKLHLADKISVRKEDVVEGSGILQYLTMPHELPLEDVIVLMMIESDNTATNVIIDQVGAENVNRRITSMGLKNTYLYKKVFRPPPKDAPADQPKFGLGKTTPREMAALIASIEQCELADAELCKRMIEIMKEQQDRN